MRPVDSLTLKILSPLLPLMLNIMGVRKIEPLVPNSYKRYRLPVGLLLYLDRERAIPTSGDETNNNS